MLDTGILAVTTRPAVRERIRAVSALLTLPPPHFVTRVEDTLEPRGDTALLVLDLGSCCTDRSLTPVIHA